MEQGTAGPRPETRPWLPAQAGRAQPPGAGGPGAPRRPHRHSVRGQVLDALRRALTEGQLLPGEVYSAPALAERYGVSATPVREAMQQLAGEGAVEVVPNRGFRVSERSPRDLAELAEVRTMLEVPALVRLARAVPPERWEELRPLADEGVAAAARGDLAGYADADHAFHRALMALTGNCRLTQVAGELLRRAQWSAGGGSRPRTAELLADASEHTALLDALIAGEHAVAERIAREHLSAARHPH
ncbi:GntR family transcriptional regulator [Streptomyces sp. RS10V-4]|uniref:GntR family transcriptional regulator n=1 Tax=Streptomyces rhizoryzae TaxID=2932493 RepID=UPI0020029A04|nr:GntR family transcriptional regulator [Streptomyces rhizoryzae]MCK7625494.1 GntR family transcriptional regulator [Streptomyces rhizoryzae]